MSTMSPYVVLTCMNLLLLQSLTWVSCQPISSSQMDNAAHTIANVSYVGDVPKVQNLTTSTATKLPSAGNVTDIIPAISHGVITQNATKAANVPRGRKRTNTDSVVVSNATTTTTKSVAPISLVSNTNKSTSHSPSTISTKSSSSSSSSSTTTTTPRPMKPKIAYSMESRPQWGDLKLLQSPELKMAPAEPPLVQPSQEFISNSLFYQHQNGYVVPIFFAILIVPLAMFGVLSVYRRMRDFWSTRHYRRMDFLIDGMYNE